MALCPWARHLNLNCLWLLIRQSNYLKPRPRLCPIINPALSPMHQHRTTCNWLHCIYTPSCLRHKLPFMKWDFLFSICFVSRQRWQKGRLGAGSCRPDCVRVVCLLCRVAVHCFFCSWWHGGAWAAWWRGRGLSNAKICVHFFKLLLKTVTPSLLVDEPLSWWEICTYIKGNCDLMVTH